MNSTVLRADTACAPIQTRAEAYSVPHRLPHERCPHMARTSGDCRDRNHRELRSRAIASTEGPSRFERCGERVQVISGEEACGLDRAVCSNAQFDAVACPRGVVIRVSGREVDEPLVCRADQGAVFFRMIGKVGAVNKQIDGSDEAGRLSLSCEGVACVAGEADNAQAGGSGTARQRRARGCLVEGLTAEKSKALNARVECLRNDDLRIDGLTPARAEQVRVDAALAPDTASLNPNGSAQPWPLGRGAVEHPTDTELGVRTQADGRPPGQQAPARLSGWRRAGRGCLRRRAAERWPLSRGRRGWRNRRRASAWR